MDLSLLAPSDLEALYAEARPVAVPTGRWRGRVLGRLQNPGARAWRPRLLQWVGFEALAWGIDFDARTWTFDRPGSPDPRLRIGRFDPSVGPSRWRDTEAIGLHYEVSRLPGPIKRVLYDEVKPLDERRCLGLGGENDRAGVGDHFWFALDRLE